MAGRSLCQRSFCFVFVSLAVLVARVVLCDILYAAWFVCELLIRLLIGQPGFCARSRKRVTGMRWLGKSKRGSDEQMGGPQETHLAAS